MEFECFKYIHSSKWEIWNVEMCVGSEKEFVEFLSDSSLKLFFSKKY